MLAYMAVEETEKVAGSRRAVESQLAKGSKNVLGSKVEVIDSTTTEHPRGILVYEATGYK